MTRIQHLLALVSEMGKLPKEEAITELRWLESLARRRALEIANGDGDTNTEGLRYSTEPVVRSEEQELRARGAYCPTCQA